MLEGKELEGKLGDFASYIFDVDAHGNLEIVLKVDLLGGVEKLLSKADNKVVNKLLALVKLGLGRA